MDQLVQCLTDDKYKGKLVAVVAGYVHDIDGLMEANPGLASRFPETLHFPNFSVDDCCRLLDSSLKNGFSTELAPDAATALRELLPPIVQVRHDSSIGSLLLSLAPQSSDWVDSTWHLVFDRNIFIFAVCLLKHSLVHLCRIASIAPPLRMKLVPTNFRRPRVSATGAPSPTSRSASSPRSGYAWVTAMTEAAAITTTRRPPSRTFVDPPQPSSSR